MGPRPCPCVPLFVVIVELLLLLLLDKNEVDDEVGAGVGSNLTAA